MFPKVGLFPSSVSQSGAVFQQCFPKWGCYLTLCVSKYADGEDRSQLCGVLVAPLPVSPSQGWGLGVGGRRRLEGAELPPSRQGWGLPTGAACSAFLSVFRKKEPNRFSWP